MKITVERIKEIIKEEHIKMREHQDLDVMVKGYGNLGEDPMLALKSAKDNLDAYLKNNSYNFENPFELVDKMAAGTEPLDAAKLEMVIDLLRPIDDDNQIDLALAKLSAVLEQRMKINEVKNEKK
mgnify:CR=1 FL=1